MTRFRRFMLCLLLLGPLFGLCAQRPRRPITRIVRPVPSPYADYAVPAQVLQGAAVAWLESTAERLAGTAVDDPQKLAVDVMLSAAVAVRAAGDEADAARIGARLYGVDTDGAKAFGVFAAVMDGRIDDLMTLFALLPRGQVGKGWRDLASALHEANSANEEQVVDPRAVLALYALGLPYRAVSSRRGASAVTAIRLFDRATGSHQEAVVDALLRGKGKPECTEFLRDIAGALEALFRNFTIRSSQLGRLMLECSDVRRKGYRASLLPNTAGRIKTEAQVEGLRHRVSTSKSPAQRLYAAESLLRKKAHKEAHALFRSLEPELPPEQRPAAWKGLFKTLAAGAAQGVELGTTLAEERVRREALLAEEATAARRCALADLDWISGRRNDAMAVYRGLIADVGAPGYVRLPCWLEVAQGEPGQAWGVVSSLEDVLKSPPPRLSARIDALLIAVGISQNQLVETADLLVRLRPHRRSDWQVGVEAALRFITGQPAQAEALLSGLTEPELAAGQIQVFASFTGVPRKPVLMFGDLNKAVSQALQEQPSQANGWPLAAQAALRVLDEKPDQHVAQRIWRDLIRSVPAELPAASQELPRQFGVAVLRAVKRGGPRHPGQFANLMGSATGLALSRNQAVLPHAAEFLGLALRDAADVSMPADRVRAYVTQFVRAMDRGRAPADQYAELREAVVASYPALADLVTQGAGVATDPSLTR